MSKKLKAVLGIFLIILSVLLMIFWESEGRKMLMNEDVIVTAREIEAGEECKADDLVVKSIPKEDVISKGISPDKIDKYIGKKFKYSISANSQIASNSFLSEKIAVDDNMSIFKIKKEWIMNLSDSVRKGDIVKIYSYDRQNKPVSIGEYYIAFVKDSSGREIVESTGFLQPSILDRTNGVSVPSYVEIVAYIDDYSKIIKEISEEKTLILIQKGVNSYE